MDFLGLRTLTTLQRSIDLVKQTKNIEIEIEKINFTDKKVLELFCRGEPKASSSSNPAACGPADEDAPGPLEISSPPTRCIGGTDGIDPTIAIASMRSKKCRACIRSWMDPDETYGIMVYQEQVMQIFNQLGGISWCCLQTDQAISKKTADVIAKFQPQFIQDVSRRASLSRSAEIFRSHPEVGGYGFNKSHSTRYDDHRVSDCVHEDVSPG